MAQTETLNGISFKSVSSILRDWQLKEDAVKLMSSDELKAELIGYNPHQIFATLAVMFNEDQYTSNLSEDQHLKLSEKFVEMAVRAGRSEGAI